MTEGVAAFRRTAGPGRGVHGWAFLLQCALFVGPMALLWQDATIAFGPYLRPADAWLQLCLDGPLLVVCWIAWARLGREDAGFYGWFALATLFMLCSLAGFVSLCLFDVRPILAFGEVRPAPTGWLAMIEGGVPPPVVLWGVGLRVAALALAPAYVLLSPRLRRTLLKPKPPRDVLWPAAPRA